MIATDVNGQPIESLRDHGRKPYAINGKKVRHAQVLMLFGEVPETRPVVKKAKRQRLISVPFALVGGGLVGYQLGSWGAGHRDGNDFLPVALRLGLGATSIVVATVFEGKANRRYTEAVGIYNGAIPIRKDDIGLSFGPGRYGYGFIVDF